MWKRARSRGSRCLGPLALRELERDREVPVRDLAVELLEFIDDVVDTLGSRREVSYLEKIAREGTSADRQLATYAATGHLHSVVDQVAAETITGVPVLNLHTIQLDKTLTGIDRPPTEADRLVRSVYNALADVEMEHAPEHAVRAEFARTIEDRAAALPA